MRHLKILVLTLSFTGLSGCASSTFPPSSEDVDPANLAITLDRTSCYGNCPEYVVKLRGNGEVSYCGFNYVEERGRRTGQINPDEVLSLYEQILDADFFDLRDEYFSNVTDSPAYTVSVSINDQTKTVRDYVGREAGMPESVTEIQNSIDEISKTSEWIGKVPHTQHLGAIQAHIPDCEDEFRPRAKAFRKEMDERFGPDPK